MKLEMLRVMTWKSDINKELDGVGLFIYLVLILPPDNANGSEIDLTNLIM